ncbi:hypothetical protein F5Y01DRAFT_307823 [Xylaria sp. FL0043]|nr:hypothetical protein F5Y01DRAFT_307823 [Xylaria sp. FL0043]
MLLPLLFLFSPLARSVAIHTRQTSQDDCSTAMKLVRGSSSGVIDGQTAVDCLQSFPYDATKANEFLTEIRKYIQFQSTLEALQNPPDTYASASVDILGGLDKIGDTVYKNQFQFDSDLRSLIRSANDGHFFLFPCSVDPFSFSRGTIGLASVSEDEALSLGSTIISPVTTINDQDVDPDARWNSLFPSVAALATGKSDIGTLFGQFTFNAGDWPALDLPTSAEYNYQSTFPSSTALYGAAFTPTKRDDSAEISPTATAGPSGFPTPFIREPYNQIIMFIPTFEGGTGFPADQDLVFGQTATRIVNTAIAKGHTKLIIDLSQNGGGDIVRAFDLFKLFFPSKLPYSATRFRRHDGSDLLVRSGVKVNATAAGLDPFEFQGAVSPTQDKAFASVDDFLDGGIELGVNVTSLFANSNFTLLSIVNSNTGPIRGFGGDPINTTEPYAPEDILIITDGICASTCTTFVNLMTNAGGPMQVMGGVRGAQSLALADLDTELSAAMEQQIDLAQEVWPKGLTNLPLTVTSGGVNLRNAYQEGADHLPLQFDYQASDCRLFYTAKNLVDPSSTWADAKAAIWGDRGCVSNSTGGRGSLEDRNKNNSNTGSNNTSGTDNGGNDSSGNSKSGGEDGDSGAGSLRLGGSLLALSVLGSAFVALL